MKYSYAYKTSDGVRHEDCMHASSREEVFCELRKRGIKAIKVVAADGTKANGEPRSAVKKRIVFAALGAGLLAGVLVAVLAPKLKEDLGRIGRYKPGMGEKIRALHDAAESLVREHANRMSSSGIGALADYEAISSSTNDTPFEKAIQAGYRELNASRQQMRNIFRPLYDLFPPECINERTDAQRIYAESMEEIDRSEAQLALDEKAYRLLSANRGKWSVEKGEVMFSDSSIAKEFAFFRRGLDPAETRWSRDFNK